MVAYGRFPHGSGIHQPAGPDSPFPCPGRPVGHALVNLAAQADPPSARKNPAAVCSRVAIASVDSLTRQAAFESAWQCAPSALFKLDSRVGWLAAERSEAPEIVRWAIASLCHQPPQRLAWTEY